MTHPLSDARDYLQIWKVAAGQPTMGGRPQDPVSGRRSKSTRHTKLLNSSKILYGQFNNATLHEHCSQRALGSTVGE